MNLYHWSSSREYHVAYRHDSQIKFSSPHRSQLCWVAIKWATLFNLTTHRKIESWTRLVSIRPTMIFMITYCHFFLEISKVATFFIQTLWMNTSLVTKISGVSFNIWLPRTTGVATIIVSWLQVSILFVRIYKAYFDLWDFGKISNAHNNYYHLSDWW